MLVRELMVQPPAVVDHNTSLGEVAQIMRARQAACVSVVDDRGELCGVVTEADFVPEERLVPFSTERLPKLFDEWMPNRHVEHVYRAARGLKVKDILKSTAIAVEENAPVEEALLKMQSVHCFPVVQGHVPIGIVSRHEVLLLMTQIG